LDSRIDTLRGRHVTVRTYATEAWLPRPVEEMFAFFSDAFNLDRITPPWLHFRVVTAAPIELCQGALLDYRLRWRLLPLRWQTEITLWEPPWRFVDEQRKGPYHRWTHLHTFEPADGGTWMRDRIEYALRGGHVEPLVHHFLVGPDVRKIFAYRRQAMLQRFTGDRSPHPPPRGRT
jgi:ligand-binding SRPBCC domain-containing protein